MEKKQVLALQILKSPKQKNPKSGDSFQQFERIKFFAGSTFNGKLTMQWSIADGKQTNQLGNILEFNNKVRKRFKANNKKRFFLKYKYNLQKQRISS